MKFDRFSLLILVSLLCACSQSVTVTQPPNQTSHIVSDTIDFGVDPLWREADTTVTLKLKSNAKITTSVTDSNFSVLSASVGSDSVLTISMKYQPTIIRDHVGKLLVVTQLDTSALIEMIGKTVAFERRVGDSYVFIDSIGDLDSIWISGLPLQLSTLDSSRIDQIFRSAKLFRDSDWAVVLPLEYGGREVRLPLATLTKFDSSWSGDDPSGLGRSWHGMVADSASPSASTDSVNHVHFSVISIFAKAEEYARAPHLEDDYKETFSGTYANEIGFFTSTFDDYRRYQYPSTSERYLRYSLLRFHLKR